MGYKYPKFLKYYKSLQTEKKIEVRDEFLLKSGLQYPSWYSKIRTGNFSKLEISALSEICGVDFDN